MYSCLLIGVHHFQIKIVKKKLMYKYFPYMSQDNISNFIENILIIVSNLPPELRKTIIKKRLSEFNEFNKSEKKEIINNILNNYDKIEREKILNLFETWIDSLSDMDNYSINSIFQSYLIELCFKPNILNSFDESFIQSLIELFNKLDENKKTKLWNCFIESISNTPDPTKFIKLIPNLNH